MAAGSDSPRGGLREFVTVFAMVANLLFLDQLAKELAVRMLKGSAPVDVVPDLFALAYVENRGAAWGMLQGRVWWLAAFAFAALSALVWRRRQVFGAGVLARATEVLLYAGILGNLLDRLLRGCVVDFLDFHWYSHHFPVFNLADVFISVAAGLMVIASLFDGGRRARAKGA